MNTNSLGDWQPMEAAPKDGTLVLFYDCWERNHSHRVYVGYWFHDQRYAEGGFYCHGYRKKPTHWMPLPGMPK